MSTSKLLQSWFPWVKSPVICNGPMIKAACPQLATEVSKAGGLGFLSSTVNIDTGSAELEKLDKDLSESNQQLGIESSSKFLADAPRIGSSFVTGHESITKFTETALPAIAKYRPAAVWLFAPDDTVRPHGAIIKALKELDAAPRIFVQVGNVTAARDAARDGADVLVCQGIDAGGHQFRRGMGIISFVPEVKHMLNTEFFQREIAVLAAGGIVDGKGVAAALALGADGVVMGTRFTVANESIYPDFRKQLVLDSVDGGTSTFKSPFNDQINNNTLWGPLYDGRAIISKVHAQFLAGASLEECQKALHENETPEEAAKLISTWAGTGVGMVKKRGSARDIVQEVREEAKLAVQQLADRMSRL